MIRKQVRVFRMARSAIRRIGQRTSARQRRLESELKQHGSQHGIPRVLVVGAAGGLGFQYYQLVRKRLMSAAGFEPDREAYHKLVNRGKGVDWYPFALGDTNREATLFVTENPRCSSCLEPNMDVLSDYPVAEWFVVRSKRQVQLDRFDSLYESGTLDAVPDFVHIDVQGFEFQVLEGFGRYIEHVMCVEVESQFKELYTEQKLFGELKEYLEEKGYFLRHIETQGWFEGEVVELNAFFTRRDRDLDAREKSLVRLWEQVCGLAPRPLFAKL